ncbi:hypothetical protein F1643_04865 [Azospirillum sp. INR13]|uniref:site-specific integrase n=1 Tax=Azospirillum sp. INR13 TaxID=2596919 RepID=UPI0018928132|nr:hypothetical protein [Azospirillum sp. INR13]
MTLAEACAEFLTHCRVAKNLSPHSLRAYTIDLAEFERFAGPRDSGGGRGAPAAAPLSQPPVRGAAAEGNQRQAADRLSEGDVPLA